MWGRGQREQCHLITCSSPTPLSVTSLMTHKWIVPFQGLIPGWVGLCIFCEAGSFSCDCNPHRFLQPEILRLSFPAFWDPRLHCLSHSLVIPPGLSTHRCGKSCPPATALPTQSATFPGVLCLFYQLDKGFFFNSLVARLSWSLIFWQFRLLFVFKLVVILLLVVRGSEVFLHKPPSWLAAHLFSFFFSLIFVYIFFTCFSMRLFLSFS